MLSGRVFNTFDREKTPEVVVVNHKLAETLWPGRDAVGKTVTLGETPRKATVVGVVADGKYEDLDEGSAGVSVLRLEPALPERDQHHRADRRRSAIMGRADGANAARPGRGDSEPVHVR